MRPTRNHYYCPQCGYQKMLFATKKEALLFLKFNAQDIEKETGRRPVRAYYCDQCCGWHLTSKPNSCNRNIFVSQYGLEKGSALYDKIALLKKGGNLYGGIKRKLKYLRHNLRFEKIDKDKCQQLIDELFDIFDPISRFELENVVNRYELLSQFSRLCELFTTKKQLALCA